MPGEHSLGPGVYYFVGHYQGAPVRVVLFEGEDNARHEHRARVAESILSDSTAITTGQQSVGGTTWTTMIVEGPDADERTLLRMEVLLWGDDRRVIGVMIGTSPAAFDDHATLRMQIFGTRFDPGGSR